MEIGTKSVILSIALVLGLIPAFATPAFALDSEFNIDFTDFYEDSTYRFCMAEEGSLPVRENCIDHTGKELASGMYPYFIAVDAQPGLRLVFYVEDITNHMIYQRTIGDSEENPEDLYFSMIPLQRLGTIQYATEEVQTETETETVTETVETDEPAVDETDEVPAGGSGGGDGKFQNEDTSDWPVCNEDSSNTPCWNTNDDLVGDEDGDDDTGGSNPDGEEDDQSCGGEACSDDEKEDSWRDE